MASVEEFRRSVDAVLEAAEAGEDAPTWFTAAVGGAAGLARSALFGTAAAATTTAAGASTALGRR